MIKKKIDSQLFCVTNIFIYNTMYSLNATHA